MARISSWSITCVASLLLGDTLCGFEAPSGSRSDRILPDTVTCGAVTSARPPLSAAGEGATGNASRPINTTVPCLPLAIRVTPLYLVGYYGIRRLDV
jgi:hypothetical protein